MCDQQLFLGAPPKSLVVTLPNNKENSLASLIFWFYLIELKLNLLWEFRIFRWWYPKKSVGGVYFVHSNVYSVFICSFIYMSCTNCVVYLYEYGFSLSFVSYQIKWSVYSSGQSQKSCQIHFVNYLFLIHSFLPSVLFMQSFSCGWNQREFNVVTLISDFRCTSSIINKQRKKIRLRSHHDPSYAMNNFFSFEW